MSDTKKPPFELPEKTEEIGFSIDADKTGAQIPSITRLLDRKKLDNIKPQPAVEPPPLPGLGGPDGDAFVLNIDTGSIPSPLDAAPSAPEALLAEDPMAVAYPQNPIPDSPGAGQGARPDLNFGAEMGLQIEVDLPGPQIADAAPLEFSPSTPPASSSHSMESSPSPSDEPSASPADGGISLDIGSFEVIDEAAIATGEALPISDSPSPSSSAATQIAAPASVSALSAVPSLPGEWAVKPAVRRSSDSDAAPAPLTSTALRTEMNPFAAKLAMVFEKGAISAVVLSAEPGAKTFLSSLAVDAKYRTTLWTQLRWDGSWTPDLWKNLSRSGAIEIAPPPPGKLANPSSSRNILRSALSVRPSEWLSLVQIGPTNSPTGVVALISRTSLQTSLDPFRAACKGLPAPVLPTSTAEPLSEDGPALEAA